MTNSEWNNLDDYVARLLVVTIIRPIHLILGLRDGSEDRTVWPFVPNDLYM